MIDTTVGTELQVCMLELGCRAQGGRREGSVGLVDMVEEEMETERRYEER